MNSKRVLFLVGGILIAGGLAGGGWWWAGQARSDYDRATTTFKKDVTQVRDEIDEEFKAKHISLAGAEAPAVLKAGAQKLNVVLARAPREPKLYGVVPVIPTGTKGEATKLIGAATNYRNAMQSVADTYEYYVAVTTAFKPVKNMIITPASQKELVNNWSAYAAAVKGIKAPANLTSTHKATVANAEKVEKDLKDMLSAYERGDYVAYRSLVNQADTAVKSGNKMFTSEVDAAAKAANAAVNQRYDELDVLI